MRTAKSWLREGTVKVEDMGDEIKRCTMTSRLTRALSLECSAYLVDDILVDTGFSFVRQQVLKALAEFEITAIVCTHNHEDHSANCAALSKEHHCPVYLRHAELLWGDGVFRMRPYRQLFWGSPEAFRPQEMPQVVESQRRQLLAIPSPGHSETHTAFYDEASGTVFTGDLFISAGVSAVMFQENPYESVVSLRTIADLSPSRMLTGHGLDIKSPASRLRRKADRIEEAAAQVVALHQRGLGATEILEETFPRGVAKDLFFRWMTEGEFSRVNFVSACLEHSPTS